MKKYLLIIILINLIIHANGQWQQTGPYGATINCITINGNVIFAGTNYGVYSSTNNGSNWVLVGLSNTPISALINKGDTIIAGISNANNYSNNTGVYISINNGSSWQQINTGLPTNITIAALSISGNNIFAGINNK